MQLHNEFHHFLPRMGNNDTDVVAFFHTFERTLLMNDVPKGDWAKYLPARLNGKCCKVLSGLSLDQNRNYDYYKATILEYFKLDTPAYLKTFRATTKADDENFNAYKNRLKEVMMYYVEAKGVDFEALLDAMLME